MLIKLFLLERGRVAKYVLTVVIITDDKILKYKFEIGKRSKYYYSYYFKYFTKTLADKERYIFKKKNEGYFTRSHVFNKRFWKRYLLWNKGTLEDSIYDIDLRFGIRVTKLF